MRIARFEHNGTIAFGNVVGQGDSAYLAVLHGDPMHQLAEPTGQHLQLSEVQLLPPSQPSKVVCVGKNYGDHIAEMGLASSAEPTLFLKPPSALVGAGQAVVLPWQSKQVDLEVELALVIGHVAKNVSEDDALGVVWGYTIANDVTARDLQFTDDQWARSKSFDTFCPVGPWVETEWTPDNQRIFSEVDGEIRQDDHLGSMIFGVRCIISFISHNMTLLPGDIVLTGTPSGISPIQSGQSVSCGIEGIGVLTNPVA
jgi:2-keto-4-pentenoate hydratase/2-oxohepta-3-ene-1,7-dioic acid hydratase in catechol pathway